MQPFSLVVNNIVAAEALPMATVARRKKSRRSITLVWKACTSSITYIRSIYPHLTVSTPTLSTLAIVTYRRHEHILEKRAGHVPASFLVHFIPLADYGSSSKARDAGAVPLRSRNPLSSRAIIIVVPRSQTAFRVNLRCKNRFHIPCSVPLALTTEASYRQQKRWLMFRRSARVVEYKAGLCHCGATR